LPIDARTKLYLLMGNPVDHSLSPAMHNAAFANLALNSIYLACRVENDCIAPAVMGMRALNIAGANVTSPFKETVIPYLDSISAQSEQIKSVNTIINQEGKLYGTTTDGEGFYLSLLQVAPAYKKDQSILVFGSGGAARAVAFTLAGEGSGEIVIINRSRTRGQQFSDMLMRKTPLAKSVFLPLSEQSIRKALSRCSLVVYALPVDSPEFLEALSKMGSFRKEQLLFDLRYKPERTAVMQAFEDKGGDAYNGLSMLFWQAVKSFEMFTGRSAPEGIMKKTAGL